MRALTVDQMLPELDRAVRHRRTDNPHARRVLRWARNPFNAAMITDLLANRSGTLVEALDAEDHLDEYTVLGAVLRAASGSLKSDDERYLSLALDAAVCVYGRMPHMRAEESATMLTSDPVGMVLAAYVLSRDLAEVEFDDDLAAAVDR